MGKFVKKQGIQVRKKSRAQKNKWFKKNQKKDQENSDSSSESEIEQDIDAGSDNELPDFKKQYPDDQSSTDDEKEDAEALRNWVIC